MTRSLVFGALIAITVYLLQGLFDFIKITLDQGLTTPLLARVAIAIGFGAAMSMLHRNWTSEVRRN